MSETPILPVMEHFYTVQGEGAYTGTPAYFIRLAGCDVGCTWCDVKESWDVSAHPQISIDELTRLAVDSGAPIVVVTGGEPAMHDLTALTRSLHSRGMRTHIETSGVYALTGEWDWVTFSPKKFKKPLPELLRRADELKVVIFHPSDIPWAEGFREGLNEGAALYLQPEWSKREQHTPIIFDYVRKHPQWRISLQTHKYMGVD
ncbi:MAG: 7-carboxy-7-deazaguanine synthase QueE [Flavobacteriales bacterium]|jgi:organic radical activating enzyme